MEVHCWMKKKKFKYLLHFELKINKNYALWEILHMRESKIKFA